MTTYADERRDRYGAGMTILAIVLTILSPLIALIVALLMMAFESAPAKRAFLRTWAIVSAVVMAVAAIAIWILLAAG